MHTTILLLALLTLVLAGVLIGYGYRMRREARDERRQTWGRWE